MPDNLGCDKIIIIGDVITDTLVQLQTEIVRASDTPCKIEAAPGGSGANQAAWLATLARADLEVHFVGRVGRDVFGQYHRQALESAGVVPHLAVDPTLCTGQIVILVEADGERNMLTDRGANVKLAWEDIPLELFQPGTAFHLSGYSLFEPQPRAVVLQALELARARKMPISVDPSSTTFLKAVGPAAFLDWTKGADWCFPNLEEGQLLSEQRDPAAIAAYLSDFYGEVVLKLGGQGALLARRGQAPIYQAVAADQPPALDCTGAGDAFCAGFLQARLTGQSAAAALAAAVRSGSRATTQLGGRPAKA